MAGGGVMVKREKSKAGLQWGQKWVSGYGGREARHAIGPAGRIRQSDLCDLSQGSLPAQYGGSEGQMQILPCKCESVQRLPLL